MSETLTKMPLAEASNCAAREKTFVVARAGARFRPGQVYRKMLVSRGDISDDRRRFWDRKDELKAKKLVAERDGVIWLARNQ